MSETPSRGSPHVLVVNKGEKDANLMQEFLETEGYGVRTASSLASFDEELETPHGFSVALIDADGFPTDLWDRCERLQREDIPFLVLSLNPVAVVGRTDSGAKPSVEEKPVDKKTLLGFLESITA